MLTTRRGRGRPRKPEGEKFVVRIMRFSPALWEQLSATVPDRQRTAFVRRAVERELRREQRRAARERAGE